MMKLIVDIVHHADGEDILHALTEAGSCRSAQKPNGWRLLCRSYASTAPRLWILASSVQRFLFRRWIAMSRPNERQEI
jgi:hypothetical protein